MDITRFAMKLFKYITVLSKSTLYVVILRGLRLLAVIYFLFKFDFLLDGSIFFKYLWWGDKTLYLKIKSFQKSFEKLFFRIMALVPTFLRVKSVF